MWLYCETSLEADNVTIQRAKKFHPDVKFYDFFDILEFIFSDLKLIENYYLTEKEFLINCKKIKLN